MKEKKCSRSDLTTEGRSYLIALQESGLLRNSLFICSFQYAEAEEQLNESAADDGAYPTNLAPPGHEEEQPHEDDLKQDKEEQEEGEEDVGDEAVLKANEKMAPPPGQARATTVSHKASSSLAPSTTDADVSSVLPPSEENDLLEEELTMENSEGRVEGRKQGYDGKHDSPDNPTDGDDSEKLKSDGELVAGEAAGMEVSTSPRTLGLPPSPVSRTSTDYEPLPESSSTARSSTQVDPLQALHAPTVEENVEQREPEAGGTDQEENHHGGVTPQDETAVAAEAEAAVEQNPSNVEEDVDLEGTDMQPTTQPQDVLHDGLKPAAPMMVDLGPEWENAFRGLLYMDGMDALGRPVVVLNADAVPPRMKSSALVYVKAHLEPLVTSGEYVIVFTARKAKLPSFWIMGAYQSLPRPYRKNVQYVVLVRPTGFLKAILAFMRPFVSRKAGRKIKTVDRLEEIGEVTGGEVTMHHLGKRFLDDDAMAAATMASTN